MRRCAIAFLIAFSFAGAYGQSTTIILNASNNGKSSYVECGTTYYFYDSGNSNNYGNSEDFTYTFESCSPITISFSSFVTESGYDKMRFSDNGGNISEDYSGTLTTLTYTASSGILIIEWHSDSGVTKAGWAAEITCTGSPCEPHTLYYDISTNCIGTASNAPESITATSATVTDIVPTCSTAPIFRGWNTNRDGSGTYYNAGDEISLLTHDVTLYARYRSTECDGYTIVNDNKTQTGYNVPFC